MSLPVCKRLITFQALSGYMIVTDIAHDGDVFYVRTKGKIIIIRIRSINLNGSGPDISNAGI